MLDKAKARQAQKTLREQEGKVFDCVSVTGVCSVYEKDGKVLTADAKSPIFHLHTRSHAFNMGHILLHEATVIGCYPSWKKDANGSDSWSQLEIETVPVSDMHEWLMAGGFDWLKEPEKDSKNLSTTLPLSGLCGE